MPSTWKSVSRSAFDEFHAPFWELSSRLYDLSDYWGHQADSKKTLIAKNRDLARVRADLKVQEEYFKTWEEKIARINGLRTHLENLQSQVGLDSEREYFPTLARVTHRKLSAWWQEISIRKGTKHGLGVGDGAIFSEGIVGRLTSTHSSFSEIELACNSNFRIVAQFKGDDRPVTFQGSGILPGGQPVGMALDVPHDLVASNAKPLLLLTSELGGTFPQGIPIGQVVELEESGDGLFKNGRVFLSQNLGKVSEVTLLSPIEN